MSVSMTHSNGRCQITLEDHKGYRLGFPCASYSEALNIKHQFEGFIEAIEDVRYNAGYRDGLQDAEDEKHQEGYYEAIAKAVKTIKAIGESETIEKRDAIKAIQELDP